MRRTIGIAVLISSLLNISGLCNGQITIALHDVGKHRSPVRVSGTISFQDDPSQALRYTFRTEGFLSNVSRKAVLLTVVHFEASGVKGPGLDNLWTMDRFFSPAVLHAGASERIENAPLSIGTATVDGHPASEQGFRVHPRAKAKVLFVQFVDGSTWGNTDVGRPFLIEQENNLLELKRLEQVLNAQGPEEFAREFSKASASLQFTCINVLFNRCKAKGGSCLIDQFHSTLQAATENRAEMTGPQHASQSRLKD